MFNIDQVVAKYRDQQSLLLFKKGGIVGIIGFNDNTLGHAYIKSAN